MLVTPFANYETYNISCRDTFVFVNLTNKLPGVGWSSFAKLLSLDTFVFISLTHTSAKLVSYSF